MEFRGLTLFLLGCLAPVSARAGFITLEMQATSQVDRSALKVAVSVTNKGDESAYHLQTGLDAVGHATESAARTELAAGRSQVESFEQPLQDLKPGRYPLVVRVRYTDANQYPFTALAVSQFALGKDAPPGLLGVMGATDLVERGGLSLKLKNLEDAPKDLEARLVLPDELSAETAVLRRRLGPREETALTFPVRNFSARPGSVYPVTVVIEYDQDGTHQTALVSGRVAVAARVFLSGYRLLLAALLSAALAVFVFLNVRTPSAQR